MDSVLVSFALIVQIACLALALSRYGFAPFPTLALVYLTMSQISLVLVVNEIWEYPFLQYYTRGGYIDYFARVIFIYTGVSIAIMLFFAREIASGKSQKIRLPKIDLMILQKRIGPFNAGFGAFVVIYLFVLSMLLDWSIVWSNSTYLLMTRPVAVITVKGAGFVLSILPFVGILCAVVSAINLSIGRKAPAIGFLFIALLVTLYYIAAHQRVALLPSVAFFVVLSVVGQKPYYLLRGMAGALAVISQASALSGRGSGSHGIVSIPDAFTGIAQADLGGLLSGLMLNVTEGIFVLSEAFTRSPTYPFIYKILSFSPFPSAIDNFATVNVLYQQRLTRYVPLSGLAEAYFFGPAFLAALIVMFWIGLTIYRKVIRRNQYIGLAVGLLLVLATVTIFAYPLRNALKPYWISVVIGSAALVYFRRHPEKRAPALDHQLQSALAGRPVVPQGREMSGALRRIPVQRLPVRRQPMPVGRRGPMR